MERLERSIPKNGALFKDIELVSITNFTTTLLNIQFLNAEYQSCLQIDKNNWDRLVKVSPQGSIFMLSGYLDAILPGKWSGIIVKKDEEWQAIMPLNTGTKMGFNLSLQPLFTKYWGIAFANKDFNKNHKEFSWKKKIVNSIIETLPKNISKLDYNFHPGFDYALPFAWNKFLLQERYTYLVDTTGNTEDDIFKNYYDSLKNSIRTAQRNNIRIIIDSGAESLIKVIKTNESGGKKMIGPDKYELLSRIYSYCATNDCGFSLTAVNSDNQPVASSLYLRDEKCVYALAHNVLAAFSHTDALSLLVHEAIVKAASLNLNFDFLGSMNESFEAFNRRFNARPVPYLNISKKNKLLRIFGR
jgi:hypothetical protein